MTAFSFYVPRAALISANHSHYWATRAGLVKNLRTIGHLQARGKPAQTTRRRVIITFTYPPGQRVRDEANLAPTCKALLDGMVDAGLFPDDNARWVEGPDSRIHPGSDALVPAAQVRVTVRLTDPTPEDPS